MSGHLLYSVPFSVFTLLNTDLQAEHHFNEGTGEFIMHFPDRVIDSIGEQSLGVRRPF